MLLVLAIGIVSLGGCANRPDATADVVDETDDATDDAVTDVVEETDSGVDERDAPFAWKAQIQDVFFDYDKYNLREDSRRTLQENARLMREHPEFSVVLEGHTDERGTREYNLALGQRRADAVRQYLIDLGVPGSQMRTISYGEERPFDPGSNEGAWSLNRRVHFNLD
jgi:peptidoglycan-associated lipoprotein